MKQFCSGISVFPQAGERERYEGRGVKTLGKFSQQTKKCRHTDL